MKLYLIRHGETDWNKEFKIQGSSDIELNEYGRELAFITREGLRHIPFDIAYTSPLKRAKETAEIILGGRNIPLYEDKRVQEKKSQHIAVFSHGAWIHSLLTYIYQREIKEYWHAPRQENCGVTTIQIEDGVCHVLKESEIFYNKDGE